MYFFSLFKSKTNLAPEPIGSAYKLIDVIHSKAGCSVSNFLAQPTTQTANTHHLITFSAFNCGALFEPAALAHNFWMQASKAFNRLQ